MTRKISVYLQSEIAKNADCLPEIVNNITLNSAKANKTYFF